MVDKQRILIVDDEADLLEMVISILEQDAFKEMKTTPLSGK